MENEVKQIAELLSGSASHAIAEYTRWYFFNAILWSSAWLVGIFVVFQTDLSKWFEDDIPDKAIKAAVIVLLALAFYTCVINILAPEAYAIHALLADIRG